MRVMVTGSRHWRDKATIRQWLRGVGTTVLIHGCAQGADVLAHEVALEEGWTEAPFPADWDRYGAAAGPRRNQQMLDEGKPDLVLAFPLPDSVGTWDAVRRAQRAGIRVLVVASDEEELG